MASTKTKANTPPKTPQPNDMKLPLEARVIQCITDFPAPKTTQDSVDQLAVEFATASLLRTHAEKRYEAAKRTVNDEFDIYVAQVRNGAALNMQKATTSVIGNEWQFDFAANKPATRVDVDELRTELVKQGVSVTVIDKAIKKVEKKATPALIVTAKPVV